MKRRSSIRLSLETLEDRCLLATRIWDGGAVSNNWSNASNWQGNVAPVAGDDLVFPAGVSDKTADNNFSAGTLFNSITLGGGYTLRGARIRLGAGGITDNSGTSNVINNDLDLGSGGVQIIQVGTGSTLFVDGEIRGSRDLHKTGGGHLSLRNNNSYTGLTDIKAGILFIEKDESLGTFNVSSAGTIIRSGATLLVNDHALGTIRTDEPITIVGGGTIRAINDVELRGNLGTTGTATLRHEGSSIERLLVSGQISGVGGVTITSGSTVRFQGTNSYQGLTTVAGELTLDNTPDQNAVVGNITVNGSGLLRMARRDQIGDAATVTIQGGGEFATQGNDDDFFRLVLTGGQVDGSSFGTAISTLRVQEFAATSSSATQSAEIVDVTIDLEDGLFIQVTDGPAFNDFVVHGRIHGFDSFLDETSLFLEGGGTTLVHDEPALNYHIASGLLRIHRFERDTLLFDLVSRVKVSVGAEGEFAGDCRIGTLRVQPGGRVRPGPLSGTGILEIDGDLTFEPGSVLEVRLNGPVAGESHDQIKVDGKVNIQTHQGGVFLEPTLGPGAAVGQQFNVITNFDSDPIEGQFTVPPAGAPFLIVPGTGQRLALNYMGGSGGNDLVLTLQNTPPMAPGLALDQFEINAGEIVTAKGKLVDPDGAPGLRLLVDWGDGSRKLVLKPGLKEFTLRHRYRRAGEFTARFKWIDPTGQGNSREFLVRVN